MKAFVKDITGLCLYLAIILGCTYLAVHYLAQHTQVDGSSMSPALYDRDHVLVDKFTYRHQEPERYDIIVFPYRYQQDTYYVKRIIGLPGETVRIDGQGTIFINGEALQENYGAEVINYAGYASTPRKLGSNEYFVLGDNRNDSRDSRDASVGLVKRNEIIGKAFWRVWPLSGIGSIE